MLGRPRESARLAAGGARGDAPVRDRQHPARLRTRSRRCSRSATGTRPTGSAPPRSAASPSSFPYLLLILRADLELGRGDFDAARAHLEAAGADPARGPRARPLRRLPRRARPLGAPLDGRRRGRRRRSGSGAPARGGADPRLALRQGTARAGGAGGARTRPPRRRRRSATGSVAHGSCSPSRARAAAEASADHTERRRLAAPSPRPSTSAPAAIARPELVVGGGSDLGAARAPAARGLLPLAPGRGARRRRRVPRRGERAAPGGARRRGSDRSAAPAARARAARPTRAARSRAAGRGAAPTRRRASKSSSG